MQISSYPSVFQLGHAAIANLLDGRVVIEEKIDGCVTPDTKILTANLEYVLAKDLKIGDSLIGCTAILNRPTLCETFITSNQLILKECVLIKTTNRTVKASIDHPWLIAYPKGSNKPKQWIQSEDLQIGQQIISFPCLLPKSRKVWENTGVGFLPRETVLSVNPIGKQTVVGLSTTSHTYTAEGMLCHNSQFSFMKDEQGNLHFRSHHKEVYDGSNSMFQKGVDAVKAVADKLVPNWVYRGEFLSKPKSNVLSYSRIPNNHIYLFDINTGIEQYLSYDKVQIEARKLGFEPIKVVCFGDGSKVNFEFFKSLLDTESILGGTKIEGLVIKNYEQFGKDKHCLIGKWVKDEMKEKIQRGGRGIFGKDIIRIIGESLRTEARWEKAIQHLKEQGLLLNEPKDIGPLLKEINQDVLKEEESEIKEQLFKWARKDIARMIAVGFPEYYKEKLAQQQFEK